MPPRREVVNFPAEEAIPPSSPLYLHPSDNPGTALVTELFNGANFVDWNRSMKTALLAKNKLGFIDGSVKKPTDSNDPNFAVWERCNSMVVSWLRNSTAPKIRSSLMFLEFASEIWKDLKERFSQGNIARIFELKQQLSNLRQGPHAVNVYYTELRVIWDEFLDYQPKCWCECNTCKCDSSGKWREHLETELAVQFLMGLNDAYSALRSHFLSLDPFPKLSKIYSLVLQEERQKGIGMSGFNQVPSQSESPGMVNVTQFQNGRGRAKVFCTHCHRNGHTVDKCFKLHGFPPSMGRGRGGESRGGHSSQVQRMVHSVQAQNHSDGKPFSVPPSPSSSPLSPSTKSNNLSADQCHQLINFLQSQIGHGQPSPEKSSSDSCDFGPNFSGMFSFHSFVGAVVHSQSVWLIDTGATHHVCCSLTHFSSITKLNNAFITLPNSHKVQVDSIGTVVISPVLTLDSVFYVPSFSHNLLSVSSLTTSNNCVVTFTHEHCLIQGASKGMPIGMGRRVGKLYVLDSPNLSLPVSSPVPPQPSVSTSVSSDLWHCRLGHLGQKKLQSMSSLLSIKNVSQTICDTCPLAKQKRLSFCSSNTNDVAVFDLIHVDIWGPFSPITVTGHKYFLTIVDDHSRFVWTYLMQCKSEAQTILSSFFHQIHTQFAKSIKTIRCDNGSEFSLPQLYSKFGTVVQHSCVERPQQNARVERKHQHLLNVARSLYFQSHIPIVYWSDCVLTASYLINRIPSSIPHLTNRTPFEILFNKPPQYSHLKAFGCLCFASSLMRDRNKFSPRAIKCVFLGYPSGYKGYKLLALDSHKIFISRDVVFHETHFPFKSDPSSSLGSFPLILPNSISSSSHLSQPSSPTLLDTDMRASSQTQQPQTSTPSKRSVKPPTYLQDYICGTVESSCPYPLHSFIGHANLSSDHYAFTSSITVVPEPTCYTKAAQFPEWIDAMETELTALQKNNTWTLVPLPAGKTPIGCKWVYRVKFLADGTIERYKARLVAQGFTQQAGIDYLDTFSPVARLVSVKMMLAISAAKGWFLEHFDINNAFLYGDLNEEIYMKLPKGLTVQGEQKDVVCKLNKSLYGLKQASRQWYLKFTQALVGFGLKESAADHSYYFMIKDNLYFGVIIYVDDILVSSSSSEMIHKFKSHLGQFFSYKALGVPKYFLGLEIARQSGGISICQRKYILDLLSDTGLLGCKPVSTPMDSRASLDQDGSPLLQDSKQYRRLIGRLLYLCITRPDITFSVHKLSQFVAAPCEHHLVAAYRVLKYLKSNIGLGLFYSSSSTLEPSIFADADWGTCSDTRRSVSGFCLFLGSSLISWRSRKQGVVSRSSAESEYRALAEASCEVSWIRVLLDDFHSTHAKPIPLFCDNKAAVYLTSNAAFHERTKHIEIDCHTVRDRYRQGQIKPMHIRSVLQLADIFTKAVTCSLFHRLLSKMSLCNIHAHLEGEYQSSEVNAQDLLADEDHGTQARKVIIPLEEKRSVL